MVENQGANTSVLWCNIARLWGQLTKSQPRAKNECVDQVSLSSMAPRGPSLHHCLIFKSARTEFVNGVAIRSAPSALSAGCKSLMRRIVMPLLLQNRSNRAYRPVPKPGPENASGTRRVGEENQQKKESPPFLHPYFSSPSQSQP